MIDVVLLGPYYYIIYPWYVRYVVWVIFVLGFLFWIILSYTLYNSEQPVIAHLNINSLSSKFEPLAEMVEETIDFLLVTESKLDETFPMGQFQMRGFSRPIKAR